MERSKLIGISLFVIVILWFTAGTIRRNFMTDDENQPKPELARVEILNSQAKMHPVYLNVRGVTQADLKVTLRAETSSTVEKIIADKGQEVKKGDPLLNLDVKDRKAKLEEAQANVESKEIEYNAAQKLFEKNFAPKTSLAKTKAAYEEAKAHLSQMELDLKNTKIQAPFDGIIDSKKVDIGQFVNIGDELMTLVDLDPIKVTIPVSEEKISLLALGQKSIIKPINGTPFEGQVTYVSRVADPATRTYQVEITSANPNYTIPDGMTVEASIPVKESKSHFISPAILSLNEAGKIGLKIIDNQNTAKFSTVEIVDTNTDGVWVMGIPDNTKIITVGQEFIKDGEVVEPVGGQQ